MTKVFDIYSQEEVNQEDCVYITDTGEWTSDLSELYFTEDTGKYFKNCNWLYWAFDTENFYEYPDLLVWCVDIEKYVTDYCDTYYCEDTEEYYFYDDDLIYCSDLGGYVSSDCEVYQAYNNDEYYYFNSSVNFCVDIEAYVSRDYDAYYCEDTGNYFYDNDGLYYYDGEYYEEEQLPDIILEYHDYVERKFFGDGSGFYGLELEVESNGSYDRIVDTVENLANHEELYFMQDGSLNNGVEIITQPCTLDYHLNSGLIENICEVSLSNGLRSHDTSTCGLHIHVSLSMFGKGAEEQSENITKLLILFNRFHDNELANFSRRDLSQLNHWASKNELTDEYKYYKKGFKTRYLEKIKSNYSRYKAVNLKNSHTVEFRLFRGTLKVNTIKASIQLVDTMINYAKTHTSYHCETVKFKNLFKNTTHNELLEYLKERNLLGGTR